MAKVTRRSSAKTTSSGTTSKVQLAGKPSRILGELSDYLIWIYGSPKCGKTTMCQYMGKPHFFMTEQGTKAVSVFEKDVESWSQWKQFVQVWRGEHDFTTAIVDTVEGLFDLCFEWFSKHETKTGEPEWGEWRKLRKEFVRQMLLLAQSKKGCVFISHVTGFSRKDEEGNDTEDIHPSGLMGQSLSAFAAHMDIIGYYHIKNGHRWLRIEGTEEIMAGCRLERNFLFQGTKERIAMIPLGTSAEESHSNLLRAFRNEIPRTEVSQLLVRKQPARGRKKATKKK